MKTKNKIIFISWAPYCSRSDNIASELGGKSYLVYYGFLGSNYFTIGFKYLLQTLKSLYILFKEHPDAVFVMSPPIVACLPALLYCKIFHKQYIIDAHTAAFTHRRWANMDKLNRFFTCRALHTNVTNKYLGKIVNKWGGRYFLLSDVPVKFPDGNRQITSKNNIYNYVVTFVNSFAPDEPLENFIKAALKFKNIKFYITGKLTKKWEKAAQKMDKHIRFTGFISDEAFGNLMKTSDMICALTTRNHTMLRGAYEAIYLGKPVIISNWNILREKFPIGAIHVDNSVEGIAAGIRYALNRIDILTKEARILKNLKLDQWNETKQKLQCIIENNYH